MASEGRRRGRRWVPLHGPSAGRDKPGVNVNPTHRLYLYVGRQAGQLSWVPHRSKLGEIVHRLEIRFHLRRHRVVAARSQLGIVELLAEDRRFKTTAGVE